MDVKKIGFGSVLAIVFSSQIGSGIFMLPSTLAPFGVYGIFGWCFAGIGAILLAMVFAELCSRFPRTGGPHTYVREMFGEIPSFFVGWAYWLVSWVSTSVVIISSIAYLTPLLGDLDLSTSLILEIALLLIITGVNCRSVELAGKLEIVLTAFKFIPFVIVPAILIWSFDSANIAISSNYASLPPLKIAVMVSILCFWGFIGLECATTPAESVCNPSKTIPRAIIFGTCAVALVYFVNSAAIMGVVPAAKLATSEAPFVDAVSMVGGRNISLLLSLIASIVCIGTLNAWMLASAQISLGLAQDGLLPKFFATKNVNNAPYVSVLISAIGMMPILVLTKDKGLAEQISYIINFSVLAFIMVYIACCFVFLKIVIAEKKWGKTTIGVLALGFCLLMIADSSAQSICISLSFFISGAPLLLFREKTQVLRKKIFKINSLVI